MEKTEYDFIVPIGEDCAASLYLRNSGLQFKSYPFDWLTNATFQMRLELLLNGFKDFLNSGDIKFLPKNPDVFNDEKCDYYENIRTGFYFYHDFPCGLKLYESLPAVREKYERRIKRLYESILKEPRVLFVWLSHTKKQDDKLLMELHNKIEAKFARKIDFLIIEHDSSKKAEEAERESVCPGICRYKLFTQARDEAGRLTTLGNIAGLRGVFSQYALKELFSVRARRFMIKFLRRLTPVKSWRKKLKTIEC